MDHSKKWTGKNHFGHTRIDKEIVIQIHKEIHTSIIDVLNHFVIS